MSDYAKRYDVNKSFEYNRENGPFEEIEDRNGEIAEILGDDYGIAVDFFGYKTKLPIGVAAGPLYNEHYMQGAAKDGFTVMTWKTFRNEPRLAHRNDGDFVGHNIVFTPSEEITSEQIGAALEGSMTPTDDPHMLSITNSFGMPSPGPEEWQGEITEMEQWMAEHNKCAITSVVGSSQDGWTIDDLAADYALAAQRAQEAGAPIIEINLSCPNVAGSSEGSIYKDTDNSRIICKAVRAALKPETKLLIKVGYGTEEFYKDLLESTAEYIDGVVAINTIPMKIHDADGKQALPGGEVSGVCGAAILPRSVEATANLVAARKAFGLEEKVKVIGCGGVMDAAGFTAHIDAGAEYVMCATAALFNPALPVEIAEYLRDNKINRKIA